MPQVFQFSSVGGSLPQSFRADRVTVKTQELEYQIKLYLLRHAETSAGADVIAGVSDHDLTVKGIEQSLKAGHFFETKRIAAIYSSPLGRSLKTSRIIQDFVPSAEPIISDDLREMNFGNWEGLSRNSIKETFPGDYQKWEQDPVSNIPDKSESPQNVITRMLSFLQALQNKYSTSEGIEIVAISHKTAMRILISHIEGEPLEHYRKRNVDNCEVQQLTYDGKRWEFNGSLL